MRLISPTALRRTLGDSHTVSFVSGRPLEPHSLAFADDGPSPYTPRLLALLTAQNIKSTFFIVGSRAISRPEMVQAEYMMGHQLSVHTWACVFQLPRTDPVLTPSLWRIQTPGTHDYDQRADCGRAGMDEEGHQGCHWSHAQREPRALLLPRSLADDLCLQTMRPPYGFVYDSRAQSGSQLTRAQTRRDIDDRVRYISLQMGLTPIIWTSTGGNTFDTRDWQIGGGVVNATDVYTNFETYLRTAATSLSSGFIVLAHDLYQQSVELAVGLFRVLYSHRAERVAQVDYILPSVLNAKVLTLEPIITCLGLPLSDACKSSHVDSTRSPSDLSFADIETASNTTSILEATTNIAGASGIGFVAGVQSTSSVKDTATDTGTSRIPGSTAGSSTTTPSGADKGTSVGAGLGAMLLGAGLWAAMV